MRTLTAMFVFLLAPALAYAAAKSPLASLSGPEQTYYMQVFSYTMEATAPGEHYDWRSYGGAGSIAVEASYVSKSGSTCRNFTETFNVGGKSGGDQGVGCKREGKEGWCRLRADSEALTCALEKSGGYINVPGVNASIPSIGAGGGTSISGASGSVDTSVNTGTIDTGNRKADKASTKQTGMGIANTVTGTAGAAAGSAANAVKGFLSDE